jgi:hypothetical protein
MMRHIFESLTAGAVVLALAWPAGAPAGDTKGSRADDSRSLEFALGIEVDADWISLNGSWGVVEDSRTDDNYSGSTNEIHQVQIVSIPNVIKRAQKGFALFRALRTTTVCLVKLWLAERPPGSGGVDGL